MISDRLCIYSAVEYKNKIWCSNNVFNGLYNVDLKTGIVEYVSDFPSDDKYSSSSLHKNVHILGDRLVFVPAYSDYITVYDIDSESFRTIRVEGRGKKEYASSSVMIGHNIWIMPLYFSGELICFNIDTLEMEIVSCFMEQCKDIVGSDAFSNEDFFVTRCSIYENKLCFAFCGTDIVGLWDCKNRELSTYITKVDNLFAAVCVDNQIWLWSNSGNEIGVFDISNMVYEKWMIRDIEENRSNRTINNIISYENRVLLVPAFSNNIYISNADDREFYPIKGKNGEAIFKTQERPNGFGHIIVEENLYFLPFIAEEGGVKIGKDFSAEHFCFVTNDYILRRDVQLERMRSDKGIFYECNDCTMNDFLMFLGEI